MPGDGEPVWPADPLRAGLPRPAECPHVLGRVLGRYLDVAAVIVWPTVTTLAAFLPARVGSLIRSTDNPCSEADWPC